MKVGSDSPPAMRGEGNSTESAVPDMPLSGPHALSDPGGTVIPADAYSRRTEGAGTPEAGSECTCPPGWKHQPGCVDVTG